MSVIIPAGFAQASFGGFITGDNEEMFFTVGLDISGNATNQMAEDLFDAWTTSTESVYCVDWSFFSCAVIGGPVPGGSQGFTQVPGVGGDSAGKCIPPNCSLLVRKTTGVGGRQNQGRFYAAGALNTGEIDANGQLTGTAFSDHQAAQTAFFDAINLVTDVDAVVVLHSDASLPTPVTSFDVQSKIATQRRRLRP